MSVKTYLSNIYDSEVKKLIENFILESQKTLKTQKLYNNFDLFNIQNYNELEQNGSFVGVMFYFDEAKNVILELERVSLQISEPQTIKLYLFDCSKKTAIATFDIDVLADFNKVNLLLSNFIMKYQDENESGKTYICGYFQNDLTRTTKIYELETNRTVDYVHFTPISIDSEHLDGVNLPKLTNICFENRSYGLDFRVSFDVDYTDLILKYYDKFANVLQFQIAKRILEDCLSSNEFNSITESNRNVWTNQILLLNNYLNGYSFQNENIKQGKSIGLMEKLVEQFEGLDDVLFPVRRKMVL
jgi:hypothetical protein